MSCPVLPEHRFLRSGLCACINQETLPGISPLHRIHGSFSCPVWGKHRYNIRRLELPITLYRRRFMPSGNQRGTLHFFDNRPKFRRFFRPVSAAHDTPSPAHMVILYYTDPFCSSLRRIRISARFFTFVSGKERRKTPPLYPHHLTFTFNVTIFAAGSYFALPAAVTATFNL